MRLIVCLLWLLYFLQGVPYGFQTKFLPLFLRSYALSLSVIGFTRLLSLPWLLKPLWAPLVDRFGTKISWIKYNLLGMALCYFVASWLSLGSGFLTVVVLSGLNVMAATQDIAVDSMVVNHLASKEIGVGNIAQVVGYKTGSLFGGGCLGWLSSVYPWKFLFFLLFVIYVLSAVLMCYLSPVLNNFQAQSRRGANIRNEITDDNLCLENSSQILLEMQGTNSQIPKSMKQTKTCHDLEVNGVKLQKRTLECNKLKVQDKSDLHQQTSEIPQSCVADPKSSLLNVYYQFYQNIIKIDGTMWTIVYILVYKLGEQGIIMIFPMLLMDEGMSSSETALLTGVWCQVCSILGSLLGGVIVSSLHWESLCNALAKLSTFRLIVSCGLVWSGVASYKTYTYWLMLYIFDGLLHFLSGSVTTLTFTLMVMCSKRCSTDLCATHYSTLSTFEVLGKLTMVSVSGAIVESIGYNQFFIFCIVISIVPIILLKTR